MAHPVRHRPGTSCRREAGPRDRFVGTGAYPGAVTEEGAASVGSQERFEDLVDQLVGTEGVTPPRGGSGFGRSALRFQGKIFAMHVRGALVVGYATPPGHAYSTAVARLCAVLSADN